MSGEMKAVTTDLGTSSTPALAIERTPDERNGDGNGDSAPSSDARPSEEQKIADEQHKRASAPVFDRLIEVNISLAQSAGRLVKINYVMMFTQLLLFTAIAYRIFFQ